MEAHGGYTFCGVAALVILKQEHLLDLRSLLVSSTAALAGFGGVLATGGSLSLHCHPLLSLLRSAG